MKNNKIPVKEYFKFNNIKNFVQGTWNKFKQDSYFLSLPVHIQEQAIYRATLCIECYMSSECLVCGCTSPQLFYAPAKEDANEKWKAMLNEPEWNKFKEENNININELELMLQSIKKSKDDTER